ncbi:MAG: ABC transporter ATP-binding protein [Planctomycetota bacterium]
MTVALDQVVIRYGAFTAVHGVTVTFPTGAVGLLGRNGAGKSSILKALLGLVRPASGTMRILDLPADARPAEIRARVGYMPERDCHLPGLNGFETVSLLGRLSGLPERTAYRRAHEVLYLCGLEEQRYRPVSGYSAGMRQKVKLAQALVHDPQVLFLDEPTNGLDPDARDEMLALVRQLAGKLGKSVVLSTHILQDVEAVCDAAVVLEQGAVVAQGPIGELTRTSGRRYLLQVEPPELALPEHPAPGLRLHALGAGRYEAEVQEDDRGAPRALFGLVDRAGGAVRQLVLRRRSMEEVFLGAVQQHQHRPDASEAAR